MPMFPRIFCCRAEFRLSLRGVWVDAVGSEQEPPGPRCRFPYVVVAEAGPTAVASRENTELYALLTRLVREVVERHGCRLRQAESAPQQSVARARIELHVFDRVGSNTEVDDSHSVLLTSTKACSGQSALHRSCHSAFAPPSTGTDAPVM